MENGNLEINGRTVTIGQPCMKDKIILVFYVDRRNIDDIDLADLLRNVYSGFEHFKHDGTVETIIVPINGETHVECINPKFVSEKEYEKVLKTVNDINEWYNELIKKAEKDETE